MISILSIPLFAFAILNTMVSLKYEVGDSSECISSVSGEDLCQTLKILEGVILMSLLVISVLLIYRKRILKQ